VVTRQPTLDAVIEGRNRGIKEWKFQRRAGMGQKVLEGSRSEENGKTSNTYMEYGLSPPRRIESRRNRERDEKQVHTMATGGEDCSWNGKLTKETIGHIQSAGCLR